MSGILKLIIEILILIVVWLIITLIVFIIHMSKSIKGMTNNVYNLKLNIEIIQDNIKKIDNTAEKVKPFASILLLTSLLNGVRKDYKKTKSDKRNVILSLAKVGIKNISTIKKIGII